MRKWVSGSPRPVYAGFLISGQIRLLGILEEKNIQQGIIVFPGNMTPSARKVSGLRSMLRLLCMLMPDICRSL